MKFFTYIESTHTWSSRGNLGLVRGIVLILAAHILFLTPHQTANAQTVHIPDPILRSALESALGKEAGTDITQAEMASLEVLQASKCRFLMLSEIGGWLPQRWTCQSTENDLQAAIREALTLSFESGIQDLTGLEFATNLAELQLGFNQISDVTPLKDLAKLTSLSLGRNQGIRCVASQCLDKPCIHLSLEKVIGVSDVSPLSDLTKLIELDLQDNQILDVSPLGSLVNLTHLFIRGNIIADVSVLKNFTKLIMLDFQLNEVSDISPLENLTNLRHLDVDDNVISDVSPLKNLTKLRFLDVSDNQISDISSLENLTNLTIVLDLDDNPISDVTALWNMRKLRKLDLDDNQITDISPLKDLTNLTWLDLDDNEISDLSPLQNLRKLWYLDLDGNEISDVTPLQNLRRLTELDLDGNKVSDISPLSGLIKLTVLDLHDNQISDISPLKDLVNLIDLDLDGNKILNVSPLSGLINLTVLDLHDNQIVDFSPIAGLVANLVEYDDSDQTPPTFQPEDVNRDGIVNILDLVLVGSNFHNPDLEALTSLNIHPDANDDGTVDVRDLVLVASKIGTAAAPALSKTLVETSNLTAEYLTQWIALAKQLDLQEPHLQNGIVVLEHLLVLLSTVETLPKATALLQNYPNPFNPETWIPYQLAKPAEVTISIYSANGQLVRTLELGQLSAGVYQHRSEAVYWDGRNKFGESVASGVYFYTLTADDFTTTGKMIIRK